MLERDQDLVFWLFVLLAFGGSSGASAAPPAQPHIEPWTGPLVDVTEGWWWWWFPSPEQDAIFQAALDEERKRARDLTTRRRWEVRKTIGGASHGATVIVFYCSEPFRWPLPGRPEPAPRGMATDLTDIAWLFPAPPSALRRMVEQVADATWEYLRELYEGRRPPREPFPWQ